jgi:hypothetical protein
MIWLLAILLLVLTFASTSVSAQVSNGFVKISDNHGSALFDVPFSPNGIPLLSRFAFELADGDNHLQQILIDPGLPPGKMRIGFHDKDADNLPIIDFDDDDYFFNITHFDISDPRVQVLTRSLDICSEGQQQEGRLLGKCTVQLDRPPGDVVFVLVGFQLSFRGGIDHHIRQVGLLEDNGVLTVSFGDEHFDPSEDTFLFSVKFAWVPRDRFSDIGESSDTRSKDEVSRAIPVGRAVLRGFRLEFKSYFTGNEDHHLKKIGVLPNTAGTVLISYRDDNGDDGFDWQYRWAILKTRTIKWPPGLEPPVVSPPVN